MQGSSRAGGIGWMVLATCVLASCVHGGMEEEVVVQGGNPHPWGGTGRNALGLGQLPASSNPYTVVPEGRFETDIPDGDDPFRNARFYTMHISSEDNSATVLETFPMEETVEQDEQSSQDGRAVCPNNPPFQALFPSARDICRVYVNSGPEQFTVCSGTFVADLGQVSGVRTFATSGHCVLDTLSTWNWSVQPLDEYPSFVCCSAPQANGSTRFDRICPISQRWRIRGVTVPSSYISRQVGVAIDDAAILALSPYAATVQDPVSYAWASVSNTGVCEGNFVYRYFGYPSINPRSSGCTSENVNDGFLHGSTTSFLVNCNNSTQGSEALYYIASACPRMSGGPLLLQYQDNDYVVGILSGGTDTCSVVGTSITAFARTILAKKGPGYHPKALIRGLRYNMRLSVP
mmetsp:Transcript_7930/g.48981  ORF Transcript_7930/g.48981 Transcript_7930/m.48981 type:complete len:404 (-) Transcript_7930:80-1291(-)